MPDFTGQSIGRYHIIEKLGMGGMAIVYKAYDTNLDIEVAIKFVRTERLAPEFAEKARKRFKIEAQKTAKLMHANIVPVIDYGDYEDVPYLVMRFIPGEKTLKSILGKPIPWQEAVNLTLPIAQALDFAHKNQIVHRDVKPSNILVNKDGMPMLTDFGIAKVIETEETLDGLTTTGIAIGTPEYMAPEQWEGKSIDGRADIYALGVVLYEMITGRPPFKADTVPATMVQVLRDPLPRPKQYTPDLPDAVEKVLFKALARNAEDRYVTMGEFALALSNILNLIHKPERHALDSAIVSSLPQMRKGNPKSKKILTMTGVTLGIIVLTIFIIINKWQGWITPESKILFTETQLLPVGSNQISQNISETQDINSGNGILYSDDFSNPNDQTWQLGGTATDGLGNVVPQYRIADGQYIITNTAASSGNYYDVSSFAKGLNFSSGVLSVDFQIIKDVSSEGSEAEFYVWVQSGQQIELIIGQDGYVVLYDPIHTTSASDYFFQGYTILKDGLNHLDMAFHDNTIICYLNGSLLTTAKVVGKTNGTIGLGSFPSMRGSSTVAFSNLIVHSFDSWIPPTSSPIPNVSTETPVPTSVDPKNLWRLVYQRNLSNQSGVISDLAFSPDGNYLASGSLEKDLIINDIRTGKPYQTINDVEDPISCIEYSPDGKYIASGLTNGTIIIWEASTAKNIKVLKGHLGKIVSLVYSQDGNTLFSGSTDKTINQWDITKGTIINTITENWAIVNVTLSPYDNFLYYADASGVITKWDLTKNQKSRVFQTEVGNRINGFSISTYEKDLVYSSSNETSVILQNMNTEDLTYAPMGPNSGIQSFIFSPDGTLAAVTNDQTIILWYMGNYPQIYTDNKKQIEAIAFSPDGNIFAISFYDGSIDLWSKP